MIVVTACFRSETKWIRPRAAVRIVHTAMGARSADDLARSVVESDRPALLLSTGFCGGLAPELRLGDLVIAEEIRTGNEIVRIDRALVDRAREALGGAGVSVHVGAVECTADVLEPAEKAALAARGGTSADLESGPLARWATAQSVPFLSCRVVLDAVDEALPFPASAPLWLSVLRHPRAAIRLSRAADVAARRLGTAIGLILDAWEESP